jgi:hypothetical protein
MYRNHTEKITNLEKQISVLDMIANDYKVSFDAKSSQYESLEMLYELKVKDYDDLEDSYWILHTKRNAWKVIAIAGIPVSFVGGVLLTVKLLN